MKNRHEPELSDSVSRKRLRYDMASQSITHSNHYSFNLISALPGDLFNHVCSMMSLEEKMTRVSTLNKSMRTFFNPALHCRGDTLVIDQDLYDGVRKKLSDSMLGVVRQISNIVLDYVDGHIDDHPKFPVRRKHRTLLKEISEAMTGTRLKSLKIEESITALKPYIIIYLMKQLGKLKLPVTLTSFTLEVWDDRMWGSGFKLLSLSPFLNTTTLHTINLNIKDFEVTDVALRSLFQSLPSSLINVTIFIHDDYPTDHLIHDMLSNEFILPNVPKLEMTGPLVTHPSMSTIMATTRQPRPWEEMDASLEDDTFYQSGSLALDPFQHLCRLKLYIQPANADLLFQFASMDTQLSTLKHFELVLGYEPSEIRTCTIEPLLVFLSKRSIETLEMCMDNVRIKNWLPFSEASVRALGNMRNLETLRLSSYVSYRDSSNSANVYRPFADHVIDRLVAPDSWPHLKTIQLRVGLTLKQFEQFVRLVPAARIINHSLLDLPSELTYCPVEALVLIGSCCPKVERILLSGGRLQPMTHERINKLSALRFDVPHLHIILIDGCAIDDMLLHLLISKLPDRSRITELVINSEYRRSLLQTRLLLRLPSVQCVDGHEFARYDFPASLCEVSPDGHHFPFIAETFAQYVLTQNKNQNGETAHEVVGRFLDTKIDKEMLDAWDRGQYLPSSTGNTAVV